MLHFFLNYGLYSKVSSVGGWLTMKSLLRLIFVASSVLLLAAAVQAQVRVSTAPLCTNLPSLHTDEALAVGMTVVNGYCYHPADLRANSIQTTAASANPIVTTQPQSTNEVYRDVWREDRRDSGRDWDIDVNTRNLRRPSVRFRMGGYSNNSRIRAERISTYPAGSISGPYPGNYNSGFGSYRRWDGSIAPIPRFGRSRF